MCAEMPRVTKRLQSASITSVALSLRATRIAGVALTLSIAIAAASIASGAIHYLSLLIALPPGP